MIARSCFLPHRVTPSTLDMMLDMTKLPLEGRLCRNFPNSGNVARIGKRDWERGFYLLVFMRCAWWIPQTSQPVPRINRSAAVDTRPKNRTSPLSAIVFLPGIPSGKLTTDHHLRATRSSKLYSIVGLLFAHTYLGDRPFKLNFPAAACRHFTNSGRKNFKNRKPALENIEKSKEQ